VRTSTSRRRFLQTTALALPATSVLGCSGLFTEKSDSGNQRAFFDEAEYRFIEAVTARLIPSDDNGPGAREAMVAVFIDRQLAGAYGRAESWYMQGPWKEGTEQQGYQLKLTPAQLYRVAIRNVETYCEQEYQKSFAQLTADQQDTVLHSLEKGTIELADIEAKAFFDILSQNTVEGFFADPMYGGNRHFAGWQLIGFPGPRYNYVDDIERYGERYPLPTVGLLGRDGSRVGWG
jgi:gluconate 2-dehydrogenase gamma chain